MQQPDQAEKLRRVARALGDIAAALGRDAATATEATRRAAAQAEQTAGVAADLAKLATEVEEAAAAQYRLLAEVRAAASDDERVLAALNAAADGIGGVAALIASVAGSSRLLALNARIEAARTGEAGRGFGVVAGEMNALAGQTWNAARDVERRTERLRGDVEGTERLLRASADRVDRQGGVTDALVEAASRQHVSSSRVASLATDALGELEEAAVAVGRVTSAARAVDLLARQVVRAADRAAGADPPPALLVEAA